MRRSGAMEEELKKLAFDPASWGGQEEAVSSAGRWPSDSPEFSGTWTEKSACEEVVRGGKTQTRFNCLWEVVRWLEIVW